ncbi:MAG: hypothetical protein P8L70_04665 [Halioglobus sp.]|nr:hypothetical protein [Halioglobus sp.]
MTLQIMSQLGELIGGVGVIFTLVYLAVQVRSNTNSQRADMTARVLERLAAQQHTFGFDVAANKFFMQSVSDPAKISIEDRSRQHRGAGVAPLGKHTEFLVKLSWRKNLLGLQSDTLYR